MITQNEQVVLRLRIIEDFPSLVLPVHHDELVLPRDVGRAREDAVGRIGTLLATENTYTFTIWERRKSAYTSTCSTYVCIKIPRWLRIVILNCYWER